MLGPTKISILSQEDIDFLKRFIEGQNKIVKNTRNRPQVPDELGTTPEVYVARTPSTGIPGLEEQTGTGLADIPGAAACDLYRLIPSTTVDKKLQSLGISRRVFNLNHEEIGGNRWVLVTRDKMGDWFVATNPGTETDTGTGTGVGEDDGNCRDLLKLNIETCIRATNSYDGGSGLLQYNLFTDRWTSSDRFRYPGQVGTGSVGGLVEFWVDSGRPRLTLDGLDLIYCSEGCFSAGPLTGHSPVPANKCDGLVFTLCLACECCSIPGWHGPGWYCVTDAANTGTGSNVCEPHYLFNSDKCDTSIAICSGPYADEIEAYEHCGQPIVPGYSCQSLFQGSVDAFGAVVGLLRPGVLVSNVMMPFPESDPQTGLIPHFYYMPIDPDKTYYLHLYPANAYFGEITPDPITGGVYTLDQGRILTYTTCEEGGLQITSYFVNASRPEKGIVYPYDFTSPFQFIGEAGCICFSLAAHFDPNQPPVTPIPYWLMICEDAPCPDFPSFVPEPPPPPPCSTANVLVPAVLNGSTITTPGGETYWTIYIEPGSVATASWTVTAGDDEITYSVWQDTCIGSPFYTQTLAAGTGECEEVSNPEGTYYFRITSPAATSFTIQWDNAACAVSPGPAEFYCVSGLAGFPDGQQLEVDSLDSWIDESGNNQLTNDGGFWVFTVSGAVYEFSGWDGSGCKTFTRTAGSGPATLGICAGPC